MSVDPRDERRHRPDHDGPGWSETFVFELVTADRIAVVTQLTLQPFERRAWYWSVVARPGEPIVAVVDVEIPMPTRASSLELRTDGLWADHHLEQPLQHATIGLEAFGLALDDPDALLRDGRGLRTPVGLDLEWETDPSTASESSAHGVSGYQLTGSAHGELLVGADAYELDGSGRRSHHWGDIDWWASEASNVGGSSVDVGEVPPITGASVSFLVPSIGTRSAVVTLSLVHGFGPTAGSDTPRWLHHRTPRDAGGQG